MPVTLIKQNPDFTKKVEGGNLKLSISEMFANTLQGEGISSGITATFIRLQGCTLKCLFCDTLSVWPNGNEYSFDEIFEMFESINLIEKFREGQHLVLTGGSPLMQQADLVDFIHCFRGKYGFRPFIEIENECTLLPNDELIPFIDQWNNSPKTSNSGMKEKARYKPLILRKLSTLPNSWFKFVISNEKDWEEIERDFLTTGLIHKNQIILMPCGETQNELEFTREITANLSIEKGVRFSDREHIIIWNRMTGV